MSSSFYFKKDEKEDAKLASKISSSQVGDPLAEMIDETLTSAKKPERTNLEERNAINQKI